MAGGVLPPWHEHRPIAEAIGEAVADALTVAVGTHVELGMATNCDPASMLSSRPYPVQAFVVRMGRPLRDVLVFLTSLREEVVRPLVETAATAAMQSLDIPDGHDDHGELGGYTIEPVIEFLEVQHALEQCDALYLEASYLLELPTGALHMVIGSGVLESAAFLHAGMVDPHADGEPFVPLEARDGTPRLELSDDIAVRRPASLELEDTDVSGLVGARGLGLETAPVQAGAGAASDIDAFDAALSAQQRADEILAAAGHGSAPGGASPMTPGIAAADVAAAPLLQETSTDVWSDLLSGVEVELSAELGRADLPLGEITSLATDCVLTLDQMVNEPVAVFVNGTRYATARLVVVDGEYGIEIIEVIDQARLSASSSLAA